MREGRHICRMRSTLIWAAVLLAGTAGIVSWQHEQIAGLRGQLAEQAAVAQDNQQRLADISSFLRRASRPAREISSRGISPAEAAGALSRADERRLILSQYQDLLTGMNLPPATAARLQNLLEERVYTVLDAEDAAMREGFAEGSAETTRAVSLAIADVDREIGALLGPAGSRQFIPATYAPEPAPPAPPPAVVTVAVENGAEPDYPASYAPPAAPVATAPGYDTSAYPYNYYPATGFVFTTFVGRPVRPFRPEIGHPFREPGRESHRH
jgi:hypothetical protein